MFTVLIFGNPVSLLSLIIGVGVIWALAWFYVAVIPLIEGR